MSHSASEPPRALTEEENKAWHRVSRASSEPRIRYQRAGARLPVDGGKSLREAARIADCKSHDPVTEVTRRFTNLGLAALSDLPSPIAALAQRNRHAYCKKPAERPAAWHHSIPLGT